MEEEYKGYTIKIEQDLQPESPREWDNVGTMVCWHRQYDLGDKHNYETPDDFTDYLKEYDGKIFSMPLYLYDHSGITMSTVPFNDRWDIGQIGWIYSTVEKAKEELGNYPFKQLKSRAYKALKEEVELYDQYISGEVYGYTIYDQNEEEIEDGSLWGLFGGHESALADAKSLIDALEALPPSKRPRKAAANARKYHL